MLFSCILRLQTIALFGSRVRRLVERVEFGRACATSAQSWEETSVLQPTAADRSVRILI